MIKKLLLFLTLIILTPILPMHHTPISTNWHDLVLELKIQTASHLGTLKNCASFSQTCKEHSENMSVDTLLFNTHLSHFLSCKDQTKALIYYAKQEHSLEDAIKTVDPESENYKKIFFLIKNENTERHLNRLDVLRFFGYTNSSIINTIKAYRAIKEQNHQIVNIPRCRIGIKTCKSLCRQKHTIDIPTWNLIFKQENIINSSTWRNALKENNREIVRIILENYFNSISNNSLMQIVSSKDFFSTCTVQVFSLLLHYKKDLINMKDFKKRNTALHYACKYSKKEFVLLLINHHCNINAKNRHKQTPLHIAINNKNMTIAKLLVANGANINIKTRRSKQLMIEKLTKKNQNALRNYQPNNLKRKHPHSENNSTNHPSKRRRK